jgi:RNA polymerase sigma-70 factor (ECF subfamily)
MAATATRADPPGREELDELTLARAQRGDAAAARALVACYQRAVFALLGRMLRPRAGDRVEDLAQETFLRVFRALPGFRVAGPARLSTWILTIATRLALDELAKRAPLPVAEPPPLPGGPRADVELERRAIGDAIQRAVAALGADHQAVFLLREVHELEYEEIARALEVDVGTVKSRLSRARAALRQSLAEVHHG